MNLDWDKVFGVRPSITADPEVLRVLYERLQQQNAVRQAQYNSMQDNSYYTDQTWREAITLADAQFLADLGISPL